MNPATRTRSTDDPWYKAAYTCARLRLEVPHDVFSTLRIDEGTELLLAHLPPRAPERVLDLGCGYGALGLPVAAAHPGAIVELVDRDLLAVEWAARNARSAGLARVRAHGSLGYRNAESERYDWILCNVPARIGRPFIEYLCNEGRKRLTPHGELRVVVIRDLGPVLESLGLPFRREAEGPRHSVYSLAPVDAAAAGEPADLYLRDRVRVPAGEAEIEIDRPFDLGGDDHKRLASGLPVLLDALPRQGPASALIFRCGYGALTLAARARWGAGPEIVAVDRDLLGTDFTRRNARALGLTVRVEERAQWTELLTNPNGAGLRPALVLGELSPSAGEAVAASELRAIAAGLAPGGEALLLALDKIERQWVRPLAPKLGVAVNTMISRQGYTVLRLVAPRKARP